jgi:hypothetical protein
MLVAVYMVLWLMGAWFVFGVLYEEKYIPLTWRQVAILLLFWPVILLAIFVIILSALVTVIRERRNENARM